jgi:hypothetical protein
MATRRIVGIGFRSRRAKATIVTAFAASALILVLAFAVHVNASGSTATTGTPSTGFVQTPGGAIPDGLPPGCYVGTLNPFTITQVPCMFNSPPVGTLHMQPPPSTSQGLIAYRPFGW